MLKQQPMFLTLVKHNQTIYIYSMGVKSHKNNITILKSNVK